MRTIPSIRWLLAPLTVALAVQFPSTPLAQVIIAGNDNKALVVDGKLQIDPQGVQSVSVIDIGADGPTLRATVEVPNSIFGPPTNLAVSADNRLALVAEAVMIDPDASPPKFVPSDKLHVIDLEADPPQIIDTLTVGRQPSGMSISPDGRLAIVANRAETSVSVLSIEGKQVRFEGKVETGDQVTHVAFTPDGKGAMINKASTDQVSFLAIDGAEVTLAGPDLAVGDYPYNADITPDGRLAIVANTGNNGRSDGNIDSITVIDLQHNPPRVIDHLGGGRRAGGHHHQPGQPSGGHRQPVRQRRAAGRLVPAQPRLHPGVRDQRRGRAPRGGTAGRRRSRSTGLQPGRPLAAGRQPAGCRRQRVRGAGRPDRRHGPPAGAARPPRLDARHHALNGTTSYVAMWVGLAAGVIRLPQRSAGTEFSQRNVGLRFVNPTYMLPSA